MSSTKLFQVRCVLYFLVASVQEIRWQKFTFSALNYKQPVYTSPHETEVDFSQTKTQIENVTWVFHCELIGCIKSAFQGHMTLQSLIKKHCNFVLENKNSQFNFMILSAAYYSSDILKSIFFWQQKQCFYQREIMGNVVPVMIRVK